MSVVDNYLVSASSDGSLRLWCLGNTPTCIAVLPIKVRITCLAAAVYEKGDCTASHPHLPLNSYIPTLLDRKRKADGDEDGKKRSKINSDNESDFFTTDDEDDRETTKKPNTTTVLVEDEKKKQQEVEERPLGPLQPKPKIKKRGLTKRKQQEGEQPTVGAGGEEKKAEGEQQAKRPKKKKNKNKKKEGSQTNRRLPTTKTRETTTRIRETTTRSTTK